MRFRSLALALQEATEGAHLGHADFRVGGKIFATLGSDESWGMVKVTPREQAEFWRADPQAFRPASGAWGRRGCTIVNFALPRLRPCGRRCSRPGGMVAGQFDSANDVATAGDSHRYISNWPITGGISHYNFCRRRTTLQRTATMVAPCDCSAAASGRLVRPGDGTSQKQWRGCITISSAQ